MAGYLQATYDGKFKVNDLVASKKHPTMPLRIASIQEPGPGFPWEWLDCVGPLGAYGHYPQDVEKFDASQLAPGALELLQYLNR